MKRTTLTRTKKLKFSVLSAVFFIVFLIIIFEVILYFLHYDSAYMLMQRYDTQQAKWWACDSVSGPRYVANEVDKTDSGWFKKQGVSWYYDRLKIVNNEGYHDRDNFINIPSDTNLLRVLFLGDSFTWGASADVDSSFVDAFEKDIKKVMPSVVWNTGIPATGTNHALFTAKKYLPLQKSNYVILGFFDDNDFSDNLIPFDRLVFSSKASCFNLYKFDDDLNAIPISKEAAYERATGSAPQNKLNALQKIIIRSRLIAFIRNLKEKLVSRMSGFKQKETELEHKATKKYLQQLNDYVKASGAQLIVLLIPNAGDIKKPGTHYLEAKGIFNELSINYVDVINLLSQTDYNQSIHDGHWNNKGHRIAGDALSAYVLQKVKEESRKKTLN